jgi:uncharacterized membrane protein
LGATLNVRTQWPWISILIAAIVALNPLGLDVIRLAFFSNEALSRNIWGPIALTALALMVLIVVLEWSIRKFIIKRHARGTTSSS